jgi:hypothetical protein
MKENFLEINPVCLESMLKKRTDLINIGCKHVTVMSRINNEEHNPAIDYYIEANHFYLGDLKYHILTDGAILNIS